MASDESPDEGGDVGKCSIIPRDITTLKLKGSSVSTCFSCGCYSVEPAGV